MQHWENLQFAAKFLIFGDQQFSAVRQLHRNRRGGKIKVFQWTYCQSNKKCVPEIILVWQCIIRAIQRVQPVLISGKWANLCLRCSGRWSVFYLSIMYATARGGIL